MPTLYIAKWTFGDRAHFGADQPMTFPHSAYEVSDRALAVVRAWAAHSLQGRFGANVVADELEDEDNTQHRDDAWDALISWMRQYPERGYLSMTDVPSRRAVRFHHDTTTATRNPSNEET